MKKYQSYKPSGVQWIGDIPENWNSLKLKHEYKIQKGRIPKTINEKDGEGLVPYLSMDVLRGSETSSFVNNDDGVFVKEGQTLILWDGSNSGEIIKVEKEGILSSTMGVLNKIGNKLNENFSFYQLKSHEPEIRNNTNGMGIPHVDGQYVRSLVLLTPPLQEQEQIVNYLDEKTNIIDKLISTKQRKVELLKEQRTTLINQVITKGLNLTVKMKDSGVEWIGEIPEHWIKSKIKYQFSFKGGGTPSTENDLYWNGIIPWVSPKDMKSKYISDTQDKISQLGLENSSTNLVEPNSLLIVVRSGILQRTIPVSINIVEVSLNQDIKSIQTRGNVLIQFLYYFIKGNEKNLLLDWSKVSCTVESLEMDYLNNFKFNYPPFSEQQQIVKFIDTRTQEIDDLVSMEQKKIELLKEYRQSLISEVITGKIKVV